MTNKSHMKRDLQAEGISGRKTNQAKDRVSEKTRGKSEHAYSQDCLHLTQKKHGVMIMCILRVEITDHLKLGFPHIQEGTGPCPLLSRKHKFLPNTSFFIWGFCRLLCGGCGPVSLFIPYITLGKTDTTQWKQLKYPSTNE